MDSSMKIKKVNIAILLDLLEELYDRGVDYVDVHGKALTEDQDVLGVSFSKDYMNPDCIENFDTFDGEDEDEPKGEKIKEVKEIKKKINLKDEDLDKLVG